MSGSPTSFTAAQIAAALGMKRQAVAHHLRNVAPASVVIVRGNDAAAWEFCQLPAELQKRLGTEARRQGNRNAEALLSRPASRWQPTIPLERICDADIQAATRLRTALLPWLNRQHDKRLAPADMDTAGVRDYQLVFGHKISMRYWRELFTRTVQRDRNFEDWNRIEIYLPEKPKAKETPAALVAAALADDFAELDNFIAACGNPNDPSASERAGVWTLALEKFAAYVRAGAGPPKIRGKKPVGTVLTGATRLRRSPRWRLTWRRLDLGRVTAKESVKTSAKDARTREPCTYTKPR
jgi:hypothetical protein